MGKWRQLWRGLLMKRAKAEYFTTRHQHELSVGMCNFHKAEDTLKLGITQFLTNTEVATQLGGDGWGVTIFFQSGGIPDALIGLP